MVCQHFTKRHSNIFGCINKIVYVGTTYTHSNLLQRVWDYYYYKCEGFWWILYLGFVESAMSYVFVVLSRLMLFIYVYMPTAVGIIDADIPCSMWKTQYFGG